jgi:hypothetical protein
MKNLIKISSLLFLFVGLVGFYSCNKIKNELQPSDELVQKNIEKPNWSWKIKLPEGSNVMTKDAESKVELPEGFYFKIESTTGNVFYEKILTKVRCECTKRGTGEGGCYPFAFQGEYGYILKGACSSCDKIMRINNQDVEVKNIEILFGEISKIKEYQKSLQMYALAISFSKKGKDVTVFPVTSYTQMLEMKSVDGATLQKQSVIEQLKQIVEFAKEESQNPSVVELTPLSVEGKLVFVELPKDFLETNHLYRWVNKTNAKCTGSCTGGRCTLHKQTIPFVGTAYWCDGCDSGCTLSV